MNTEKIAEQMLDALNVLTSKIDELRDITQADLGKYGCPELLLIKNSKDGENLETRILCKDAVIMMHSIIVLVESVANNTIKSLFEVIKDVAMGLALRQKGPIQDFMH